MKVGVGCIPVGKMLVGLHQDREQRDRSHNYTALSRATFILVIPEAFMLVNLVSQRRLWSPGVVDEFKARMTCAV